ncbi:MAG: glycosyltransferase involved in cell wall biosynthesis [Vicingaceae bacterium]|jgi:glycosyltransferase involved in cell wall biosynthesis
MINLGILTAHHYPRLGGMEYVTHFMANELNKRADVNVSVACNSLSGICEKFQYEYNCYRSKKLSYLTPWLFRYNQEKMIREQSINLLHGPMLHGGGYDCYKQNLKYNIPFIGHSHGADVQVVKEIGYGALLDNASSQKVKKVIQHADHLIAISQINKENMLAVGAEENKISVIHNGVEIEKINSMPFQSQRQLWGVNEDDFLIITVGRNKPVKRMELLFKALNKLKEYNKIKCICVGPTLDLKQSAAENGSLDQVIFTGQIPDQVELGSNPPYPELINLYRSSNLYISTSYVESFGSAAADALACGIPVIVGSKHGVQDIIECQQTGFIMEKETSEELADLILECYKNRDQLKALSKMIKGSVAHVNWANITDQYERVFKSII